MLNSVFKTVLDMTLSSSFLIVAVLVARVILRKSSKVFRKILWGLVALKLIIPFSFESVLSLVPHESTYMPQTAGASAGASDVAVSSAIDWQSALPYVWVSVCVILLIYAILSFVRLKLKISDAVKYQDNIFQSERVESPFVFGIFKPKIYIPYTIKGAELRAVLEHEKAHIKSLDHITKISGFVLLCVHWFNPLVWVSYVLFCKDLELACDEAVIRNMSEGERKGYALTLCDIGVNKAKISACPIAFGEVSIKERIKSTLSYKRVGKIAISLSLCLCAVVAVCFMTKPVAEAKVKIEETVVEETTLPDMEAITEPTTELTTESITEPVTEEATTESSVVTVEEDAFAESRERLLRELEKNKTTTHQTTGKGVGAAYNSLQNSCYIIKENSGSGAAAYDGDVIIETHETANSSGNGSNNGFKNPFVNKYY